MNWLLALVCANISICYIEWTYRAGQHETFYSALPYIFVPIMLSQWALFVGFKNAPSLFAAGACFSLMNVILRIGNTYILAEQLNRYNWLGVAFLAASVLLLKVK